MTIEVAVETPANLRTPRGETRLIPIAGGRFDGGPDLAGAVLPGGADWQTVRADGALEIRAHYLLETDRGERIEVVSEGVRHAAPDVLSRLAAGESVPADQYYFRTHVRTFTGSERLDHLNNLLAVATGERRPSSVHLTVYSVP
jgi:hypothetical protein